MEKKYSEKKTKNFYNELMNDKSIFTFFTKDTRYNADNILKKKNIEIFFDKEVKKIINKNDLILDYGCGPGTFSIKLSRITQNNVHSVDISRKFLEECEKSKKKYNAHNIKTQLIEGNKLPFNDDCFDKVLLFDVIHHLDEPEKTLREIYRVLKKNGKIIIYEPNKLNPLIALIHLIDPIERGLLKFGTKKSYLNLIKKINLKMTFVKYSGIVVGPDAYIFELISKILNKKIFFKYFGWLNPKIFFIAEKN
jgi:ubiquinone/menaquinone biosynthesis C-methylase UbiE